jgi:hypothetical protein
MRGVRHSFLAVVLLLVCGMASASARVVTATARNTSSVAVPNSSANPLYPLEESHLPPNPRNGLFVANNPINAVDPWGLAPGDPYASPDAAAVAALNDINPTSIRENVEYGGLIKKILEGPNKGQFTYTEPRTDKQRDWVEIPERCPKDDAGAYHTHSGPVEGDKSSEVFSEPDMDLADHAGTPFYLGTPEGRFGKYTPWPLRSDGTQPNPRKGTHFISPPGTIKTQ